MYIRYQLNSINLYYTNSQTAVTVTIYIKEKIRYDTIEEFNVDSKAEYTA